MVYFGMTVKPPKPVQSPHEMRHKSRRHPAGAKAVTLPRLLAILTFSIIPVLLTPPARASSFTLTSPDIANGATIKPAQLYNAAGCSGGNQSPALHWQNAPTATQSYAVTVLDESAPGNGFWHWIAFDVPAATTALPRGAGDPAAGIMPPTAIQLQNDFGTLGYAGPCPPKNDPQHHYRFTIYALDTAQLPGLDADSPIAAVTPELHLHSLATSTLTASYP
jgi:Raf kinase inhibitor-like YbhB/YbcL family protein